MNLEQLLEEFKNDKQICNNITHWTKIPEKEAQYASFNANLSERLQNVLKQKKIYNLYTHQHDAIEAILEGKNVVVVTPTASGKTLCYNLPVLHSILNDLNTRALYLFPTKALSQDQVSELHEMITLLDVDIKTYTYDGDTPVSARRAIRQAGHIVVTNPDMLHSGIMPHHTKWVKLFENLQYVVIDEIHMYRGVFGSHFTNVIRRLKRICDFYGSKPQFICCSATIANPDELTQNIIGENVVLIDKNGAPAGCRNFIFYNPPVVNKELGIRRSSLLEVRNLAKKFILNRIQNIIFTRSRLNVEILTSYLKKMVTDQLGYSDVVRGYRGGYLPTQRRKIEQGLRTGEILSIISTNALELGIDIGRLDACLICGYPGTISSIWQQAGRAGRRSDTSVTIFVASSAPIDQYIIQHPDYFFNQSPEYGLVNPDNLYILLSHFKCAAYELPFNDHESFGTESSDEILHYFEEQHILRHVDTRWHWMAEEFPAEEISLRSASNENFVIIDITDPEPKVIGQIDRFGAPMLIHEEAIYLHEGQQYQVEKLDFTEKKAYIRKVNVDYYTDASLSVNLKVLDVFREEQIPLHKYCGEVTVISMVTMFKKIKFETHENIGWGPVDLPELEMQTTAYWFTLSAILSESLQQNDMQNGLVGISNILSQIAPIFLMCDPADISVIYHVKSPFTQLPTIFIYDQYPGGVGFSEKLYEMDTQIFETALDVVDHCKCENGCPSCIGPVHEVGILGKEIALKILEVILNDIKFKKQT